MVLWSFLTPHKSRTVYYAVVFSNFSCRSVLFTPNRLRRIKSKAQQAFTAKCGFHRKMSLAIRYCPLSLGGAGFVQISTIRGEGQLTNFLNHRPSNTDVSSLLRCVQSGVGADESEHQCASPDGSVHFHHLESVFLQSTHSFLSRIDGEIEADDPFMSSAQRTHDEYLMDVALGSTMFTTSDLHVINYCLL
jgi:hypothetical protein